MSTTAQDSLDTQQPLAPGAEEAAQAAEAPATSTGRSSTRSYTLFEEARTDTWTKLGEVEADSPEAALETLGEQKLKQAQGRFTAVPSRFFRPVKPNVTTVTTISFD
ncbi:MAG TPA: hypothetical protein VLA89_00040 [Gemmatimonadales bacterium]|nr:hypothetical protein [Gemmatimonadales bacterium]